MGKKIDLLNQRFGRLVVIDEAPKKGNRIRWKCLCDCGNEKIVDAADLKRGHTTSCGCYKKERVSESSLKDYTGQKFGRLLVKEMVYKKNEPSKCICICDCGKETQVRADYLVSGNTRS